VTPPTQTPALTVPIVLTGNANNTLHPSNPGSFTITYTGGAGTDGATTTNKAVDFLQTSGVGPYGVMNNLDILTLTQAVQAPTEIVNFYLTDLNESSDITATLSGGSITTPVTFSLANINSDSGLRSVEVSLNISGAAVGETLTFQDSVGLATSGGYPSIGINAANVLYGAAIPEPSTYLLMGLGLAGLLIAAKARKSSLAQL
jgi:hypothetical protein